jgi:saccharopine dehydrogenase-like NADP-dependent oxidoreductase
LKHIVVFGAGKSSTSLIDYLIDHSSQGNWRISVLDNEYAQAFSRTGNHPSAFPAQVNVNDHESRRRWIEESDIVISLMPPSLHYLLAKDCIEAGRPLLTASYVDEQMRNLAAEANRAGVLLLCEMGLDPGIDHMSAVELISRLRTIGARIVSFKSHCGGLVAPEYDTNPWRYKISWNPRNVVLAGKSGARFLSEGNETTLSYEQLFDPLRVVEYPQVGPLAFYPNRDSLPYIQLYGLEEINTFIRTTLRYPEFCFGWKNIIELKLTDETPEYETDGMSLKEFFQIHFQRHGFSEWIDKQLTSKFNQTKLLLEKLQELISAEQNADEHLREELKEFMIVDKRGSLLDVNLNEVKNKAAATVAGQMHEANLAIKQLMFLGMADDDTVINRGYCSAADVLQFIMEKKLMLAAGEKDLVLMLHEIEYELDGEIKYISSRLAVRGIDNVNTAMATTVGLPLAVAAEKILNGEIACTGLQIPTNPEIYVPVMKRLHELGISFIEEGR